MLPMPPYVMKQLNNTNLDERVRALKYIPQFEHNAPKNKGTVFWLCSYVTPVKLQWLDVKDMAQRKWYNLLNGTIS